MVQLSDRTLKQITDSVRDSIRKSASQVLKESDKEYIKINSKIPKTKFITGKGSNQYSRKIRFGYNHKDVRRIEEGEEAKPVTGIYTQNVKAHKRELGKPKTRMEKFKRAARFRKKPPRTTRVRAHKREYKNMKLVNLGGSDQWRVVSQIPAQKGKKYLEDAANEVFKDTNFSNILGDSLKKNLTTGVVTK